MADISLQGYSSDRLVLVVGAANLDMIGILNQPIQQGQSNPANIRVAYGGVGRNVAENLARLGQPVRLITAVGNDHPGVQLLTYTAACEVQVLGCVKSDIHDTGCYLAVLDADGSRFMTLEDMEVLSELTPEFIQRNQENIAQAAMLFIDANLRPETLDTLIQLAFQARVPICADTASSLLAERLLPYLDKIYMLTANRSEASMLCKNNPVVKDRDTALQAARHLVNQGVELVVISLGEAGVVYATSETSGHVPAVRVNVLDPTGAGDALTATVIFGLLNDIPIDESVKLGVTAASLILRHRGTVFPELTLEKLYDELVT